jgi:uncharacterized protein
MNEIMQETKQEHVLPSIRISTSKIHGTGVYAGELIAKGRHIIEYIGEKIPAAEGSRREKASPGHTFVFSLNEDWDIDAGVGGNDSRFINHSCDPNTEVSIENDRIWIFACRDIAKGEEITYDYSFDANEPPAPCTCKAPSCRGSINIYDPVSVNKNHD